MYYIVLCDDDSIFLQDMKKMFITAGLDESETCFYEFASGEELEKGIEKIECCDLCILDMQMTGMDGDETARIFRKYFQNAILVFCSGTYEPTTKSFETEPYRYLLKSYTDEEMLYKIKEIIRKVQENKRVEFVVVKSQDMLYKLKPEQILYIEIYKRGSLIHLKENEAYVQLKVKDKLDKLYGDLQKCGFAYAHNSYIINLNYVKILKTREVGLIDGTVLNVSRAREKELHKAYMKNIDKY